MPRKIRHYESDEIDVEYDVVRCIHAEECINRLRAVFDPQKRPWIQPENALADAIADMIPHCPTGALHYTRKDGGAPEATPPRNRMRIMPDGPLYLSGDFTVSHTEDGVPYTLDDTRIALCRCGASQHRPFCDNSHRQIEFRADGIVPEAAYRIQPLADPLADEIEPTAAAGAHLTITATPNGPLQLHGLIEIVDATGQTVYRGSKTALCRCGASRNRPFCDGTHTEINFRAE